MRMPGRKSYPRTFHPDTTEVSQAKIIEVSEGSEVTGVDIQLSPPVKTYSIVGTRSRRRDERTCGEPWYSLFNYAVQWELCRDGWEQRDKCKR